MKLCWFLKFSILKWNSNGKVYIKHFLSVVYNRKRFRKGFWKERFSHRHLQNISFRSVGFFMKVEDHLQECWSWQLFKYKITRIILFYKKLILTLNCITFQNGQAHITNLAPNTARFLNCVWPFWDVIH